MVRHDKGSVAAWRLTAGIARKRVRELASDSRTLVWTDHIQQRMVERGISTLDVLRILRDGEIEDDPVRAHIPGDWRVKLVRRLEGRRTAGVVTVIAARGVLILVTAEWEDGR
jgi:hypothetical protein